MMFDLMFDLLRHERDQEEALNRLPRCSLCGEPIQQEDAVNIDNDWFCDDCLKDSRRDVWSSDY